MAARLRSWRGASAAAWVAACPFLLAGCGVQSPLDPRSEPARKIETLWWWMLAAAAVVFLGAVCLLALAWWRRDVEGLPLLGTSERAATGLVIAFGIVIPLVTVSVLFAIANFSVARDTDAPDPGTTELTIEVIGHQWFWEVRYPGTEAVTANEIHIPARTRVNVVVRSADVVHSFWAPQLNRKVDAVPGRSNRLLLYADEPGRYRGDCAELCGAQHSRMGLAVYADPPGRFRAWLSEQARPAADPASPAERTGQGVFLESQCADCHTIRGTPAIGDVGPDLTHLQTRETIAALTLPNTPADVSRWVRDPQAFKPGNRMPVLELGEGEHRAVIDYLESLR
jgi:cytochrome c oxidase subunit II